MLRAVEGLLQIAVDFHGSVDNEKEQEEEERRDALDVQVNDEKAVYAVCTPVDCCRIKPTGGIARTSGFLAAVDVCTRSKAKWPFPVCYC